MQMFIRTRQGIIVQEAHWDIDYQEWNYRPGIPLDGVVELSIQAYGLFQHSQAQRDNRCLCACHDGGKQCDTGWGE